MNKANIISYLEDPSQLFSISYEELKTLALEYPYNTNFKYLFLAKSSTENNSDLAQNLHLAALYSIDRSFLRRLMLQEVTKTASDPLLSQEEVLELKDTRTLELDIQQLKGEALVDTLPSVELSEKSKEQVLPVPPSAPEVLKKIEQLNKEMEALDFSREEDLDKITILTGELDELLKKKPAKVENVASLSKKTPKRVSTPKAKKKTRSDKSQINREKEKEVNQIAVKSVEKKETVATETLALILERQGLIAEAIEMYQQLILTFPEKKTFFAAKIKNLKK